MKTGFQFKLFLFLICSPKFPILCDSALRHYNIDNLEISMIRKLLSHILHNPVIFPFIQVHHFWSEHHSTTVSGHRDVTSSSRKETFSGFNISFCFLFYSVLRIRFLISPKSTSFFFFFFLRKEIILIRAC